MAILTVQTISLTGSVASYAAAEAAGDSFPNANNRTFFTVVSAAGVDRTLTFNSQVNCDQGEDHDVAVVVSTGTTVRIGPFPPARFNDANGRVVVTYSSQVGLTVAAVQV